MIETGSLGKEYERKEILRDVSISVRDGEIFGLIGPSGSGKSTLLRILDLIETPTTGSLSIFGEDALDPGSRFRIRRRMAMLNQKPVVFSRSVFDNIAIGLKYRGVSTAETRKRVMSMLGEIGLSGYDSRSARTLSGGEAQRVALARAVVTEPEILFLDEPTANLDPVSVEKIEEIVLRLNRDLGITTVISTHDMLQGQRLAKRIGVLMDGSLGQTGTTREIFHQPATKNIAQFVRVENIYPGTVVSNRNGEAEIEVSGKTICAVTRIQPGKRVNALFRAEDVTIHTQESQKSSARNLFPGTITRLVPSGPFVDIVTDCGGLTITAMVTLRSAEDLGLIPGMTVLAALKATAVHVIPEI